ncbi:NADP-dependent malic enzyme [Candidatus Peribacteria bacterium]|jgi:malate dehydrogenase (oxaloacetate-decarboxylating)|nr:NADP-dependent malic enzyme [Candidatus Peribacteria bacterium]MBT4021602.1 NADP-dependent malic enzyme [Candidatus Peribacteria bacterium]MBT4240503.1 NADP-dependent malic enzyme [Candidatus Peribacteria bacterium]MBT4474316.1 NADP-dependent malic enzyme [Candidatus Peribacteria bacterium]
MPSSEEVLKFHAEASGKIEIKNTTPISNKEDLALTYTPGVAIPSKKIFEDKDSVWTYTGRRNRVAVVSDGSAVLGLGKVGPEAALPVMEGKAAIFKEFAGIDAFPICINSYDTDTIIKTIESIAPSFGGINLEDISAPRCFEIEEILKEKLDIPVFHDDQHGTAIVVLAALQNALKVTKDVAGMNNEQLTMNNNGVRIVISGAGAAGTAIARILLSQGFRNILVIDSKGIINRNRSDMNCANKMFLAAATNPDNEEGPLENAVKESDVFIGVSTAGLLTKEMIGTMNKNSIVFAMANPDPEIMPEEALEAGARIVATGRSDFPNQVNNILAFPGIFRGALDAASPQITEKMKLAAAKALAECIENPTEENIIPDPLDKTVVAKVANAVKEASS